MPTGDFRLPTSFAQWGQLILSAVALAASILSALLLVRNLLLVHTAVPFNDQFFEPTPRAIWGALLARHNEHWILLPRLGFLLDFWLARGTNTVNFATILLLQAAHALLVAWVASTTRDDGKRLDPVSLGVALGFVFSAYQLENFIWGFQTGFVGVFFLATACFVALFFGGTRPGATLAACALGVAASLTLSNGVVVLALAAVVALLAGRPWRQVLPLAVSAVVLLAVFAAGLVRPPGHSAPQESLQRPLHVAVYTATYIGAPAQRLLGVTTNPAWISSALFGAVGLLLAAGISARALLARQRLAAAEWVFLCVLAFLALSAAATATGRLDFGFSQARTSRYGTPALLFWACLLLWGRLRLAQCAPRYATAAAAVAVGAVLIVTSQQMRFLRVLDACVADRYPAETSLIAGVADTSALLRVSPKPEVVLEAARELRAGRWGIFAAPYADWMGRPLAQTVRQTPPERCLGSIESAVAHDAGAERFATARGWAWDAQRSKPVLRVLLVDQTGRIVGFARGPLSRPDLAAGAPGATRDDRVGWAGHAILTPGMTLRAFALVEEDATCPLPGERAPGP